MTPNHSGSFKIHMARDLYEILGLKRDASADDIKHAYRKLAQKYHPDRNPGDKQAEASYKEVQSAYDVLSDPSKRTQYDRFGGAGGADGGFPGGGGPRGQTFHWGGGSGGFEAGEAADVLRQFFGGNEGFENIFAQAGRQQGRGPWAGARQAPPQDAESEITLPFLTAANGGTVGIQVNGRQLDVKVPPGVEDGKTLRLHGQAPGGGDLLLKLHVEPHPYFRREGSSIILEVPVTVAEAALGSKVEVPTLDGSRLAVKVPPGTSSGARLRLRGKGIAGGDQFIEIKVVVPAAKEGKLKELFEEIGRLNPDSPRADQPWS